MRVREREWGGRERVSDTDTEKEFVQEKTKKQKHLNQLGNVLHF